MDTIKQIEEARESLSFIENAAKGLGLNSYNFCMTHFHKLKDTLKRAEINERVLQRIASGEDWFPIESAPRDGTEIRLFIPSTSNGFSHVDIPACMQRETSRGKVVREGWYMLCPQGVNSADEWYPCHWLKDEPTHWKHIDGEKHIKMLMEEELKGEA